MSARPEGSLIQIGGKNKDIEYVFFPDYYYDKESKTKHKEKQRRVYIGKMVEGNFVPNDYYLANPKLTRADVKNTPSGKIDIRKFKQKSCGTTSLLYQIAIQTHLKDDLESIYSSASVKDILSLAMYMILEQSSTLSRYPAWADRYEVPSCRLLDSSQSSRLLHKFGEDKDSILRFFKARLARVQEHEYLSYDSTKIASTASDNPDVTWGLSKEGSYQQEITLSILCGHQSRTPVMFRVMPGNLADVTTVEDLTHRWSELGVPIKAIAVLDRGYDSLLNIGKLCENSINFVIGQKTGTQFVRECIEDVMPDFWNFKYYISLGKCHGVTQKRVIKDDQGTDHTIYVHMFRSELLSHMATEDMSQKIESFADQWLHKRANANSKIARCFDLPDKQGEVIHANSMLVNDELRYSGFFVFVSNCIADAEEAFRIYRGRDCVEKAFRNLHTELDMTSCEVHNNQTLNGKLLICFCALTLITEIVRRMEEKVEYDGKHLRLLEKMTINDLLDSVRNIYLISSPDCQPRVSEITKKQLSLFKCLKVGCPSAATLF